MTNFRNTAAATVIGATMASVGGLAGDIPVIGNFLGAKEAAADCNGSTASGKRMGTKRFNEATAATACGINVALHGYSLGENSTGTMDCPTSLCPIKRARIEYNDAACQWRVIVDEVGPARLSTPITTNWQRIREIPSWMAERRGGHCVTTRQQSSTGTSTPRATATFAGTAGSATGQLQRETRAQADCSAFRGLVFQGNRPTC